MSWAKQLNMNLDRGWRTIQHICEIVENDGNKGSQEEDEGEAASGNYILLKEFNSMKLNLFKKPQDEEGGEEEEDETQIRS